MRTTPRRITLPEKMLWLMGLGASVSLFYRVQDYCSVHPKTSSVVIPYELFNLEGKEEQPREMYYETRGGQTIISESKNKIGGDEARVYQGETLVELLNFE